MNLAQAAQLVPAPADRIVRTVQGYTDEIVNQIVDAAQKSVGQTRDMALRLRGATAETTLYNVWRFVRENIRYVEDPAGVQMIKWPSVTIRDGFADCKSMSLLIGSLLHNLGIEWRFRFAKYDRDMWQHVYVRAKSGGKWYTLDACLPQFNEEQTPKAVMEKPVKIYQISGPAAIGCDCSPSIGSPESMLLKLAQLRQQILTRPEVFRAKIHPANALELVAQMERVILTKGAPAEVQRMQVLCDTLRAAGVAGIGRIGIIDPGTAIAVAETAGEVGGKIMDIVKNVWEGISNVFDSWFGPGPFDAEVDLRAKMCLIGLWWIDDANGGASGARDYFRANVVNRADRRGEVEAGLRYHAQNTGSGDWDKAQAYWNAKDPNIYQAIVWALLRSNIPAWKGRREYYYSSLPRHKELIGNGNYEPDLVYYLISFLASMYGSAIDQQNGYTLQVAQAEILQARQGYAQAVAAQQAQAPTTGSGPIVPGTQTPGTPTPTAGQSSGGAGIILPAGLALLLALR